MFRGQERKRKDGWVPEGAKTGTSVIPSYNRANDDCSILEMPLFNGVDRQAAIKLFNGALVQHHQETVDLKKNVY